jgi:SAM-dependent methyltransferase
VDKLLPDRLKELWGRVERKQLTVAEGEHQQGRLLDEYRAIWTEALILEGQPSLRQSLLSELAAYLGCVDLAALESSCKDATRVLSDDWRRMVDPADTRSIERFYDQGQGYLFELMWWHTLVADQGPLAYVLALDFARQRQSGRRYLDFGAGVGAGGLLFARHGFDVTHADISSTLLRFSQWRMERRGLSAEFIDLKDASLPPDAFDTITAMDVFEHLPDPVKAIDHLAIALKRGGFLFGRFAAEPDEDRPQHIVFDFGPVLERLTSWGFTQVWRDAWLWGHQAFQKVG